MKRILIALIAMFIGFGATSVAAPLAHADYLWGSYANPQPFDDTFETVVIPYSSSYLHMGNASHWLAYDYLQGTGYDYWNTCHNLINPNRDHNLYRTPTVNDFRVNNNEVFVNIHCYRIDTRQDYWWGAYVQGSDAATGLASTIQSGLAPY
jgi:hypothetical protein